MWKMKPFAPLLAVGHDVDAERLLLAQRHDGGVVLRLVERLALETEGDAVALGFAHPARARHAADMGGGERREFRVPLFWLLFDVQRSL